jgi:hypothetical protein
MRAPYNKLDTNERSKPRQSLRRFKERTERRSGSCELAGAVRALELGAFGVKRDRP